jgi:cellulose synthase/poly-beta-1,6-N-acetylglucosamine synthase-like glycosyltransferase
MVTMILQTWDLVANHAWHPFFFFFCFVWIVWLLRIWFASHYIKYDTIWDDSISVVVPTRGESPEETEKCVLSLISQTKSADEIIFVIDKSDVANGLPAVFQKYNVRYLIDDKGTKRDAFALGARATKENNIMMMLAGDCIYPPHFMSEAIKPFADPKVGGVALTQSVKEPRQTFARRLADWMYDYRFKVAYPMMGWKGVVVCLTGETFVARRELVMKHLDEFLNERFMGRRCIPGDDRFLTTKILREGYKCVYQVIDPPVLVDAPNSFGGLVKQQLRWLRTSQRYTFQAISWCWGKSLILPFHLFAVYLTLYSFVGITIWGVVNGILGLNPNMVARDIAIFGFPWIIAWGVLGLYASHTIRQIIHLKGHPEDWGLFWLYIPVMIFIFVPLTVYALFTMRKTGWLVRGNPEAVGKQ